MPRTLKRELLSTMLFTMDTILYVSPPIHSLFKQHLTYKFCVTQCAAILLKHKAKVDAADRNGRTPLHGAACFGLREVLLCGYSYFTDCLYLSLFLGASAHNYCWTMEPTLTVLITISSHLSTWLPSMGLPWLQPIYWTKAPTPVPKQRKVGLDPFTLSILLLTYLDG